MLDTVGQRNALLGAIERARDSSVIAYFLHDNAVIADDALPQLYDKLFALGRRERIDLLLYARSGVTEVCWRVLNLLREYCDHLGVIVAPRVQGAGTLLALGADEIVMGPLSEVGGLDSFRKHPLLPKDELGQSLPASFGEIKGLFAFLREWGLGNRDRGSVVGGRSGGKGGGSEEGLESLAGWLGQIHPLVIAHLQEADALSRHVTRKALRMHMSEEDEEKVEQIVEMFNGGFHSPLYTTGRGELAGMGLPVVEADRELWSSVWGLAQLYQSELYIDKPEPTNPGAMFRYVCVIETVGRSTGLRQMYTQVEGQERALQMRWETAIKGPGPGPSFGPGGMSNN